MLKFLTGIALTATLTSAIDDYRKIDTYHAVPTSLSISYDYEKKREDIHDLEKILVAHAHLKESDECFDVDTENGLKRLQGELDLKTTGKVDKHTREKLNALFAEDFAFDLKKETCRIGEERKLIHDVSENLLALHYFDKSTDHLTKELIYAVEVYKRMNTITNSASLSKEFLHHLNMRPEERVKKLEEALAEFKKLETTNPMIIAKLPEYRI
ncbi:peptidoglycan-binding protein [Candidatus Woesearchaeota archaeon]|nr:peptidoglycan-binding protein [Candidatus Woesearchaeota archaeon]